VRKKSSLLVVVSAGMSNGMLVSSGASGQRARPRAAVSAT
jgi:hypothetical protein